MWTTLAHNIIKFRLPFVIILGLITIFMATQATKTEMSFDFAKTVPSDDPDMVKFDEFKSLFGEDGNIIALGVKDSAIYQYKNFEAFSVLAEKIANLEGINNVMALPNLQRLKKNAPEKRFDLEPIFASIPQDQVLLDSMLQLAREQKFYSGQLINETNGATLMLISISKDVVNSPRRIELTNQIIEYGDNFSEGTAIKIHYAGLPLVRSLVAGKVKNEMVIFLILSVVVTGIILLLFFRAWNAVVFPMIIIAVVVVWVMGSLVLFGYKITLLTGLIPPIIVVIGIPNGIYLMNKYHQEFEKHGNKMRAISRVTTKIGFVTLITNFTTAIGFLVLVTTDIVILKEFGIIAGLNILATFVVSIVLIPSVFSWLPAPSGSQLKHLKLKLIDKGLNIMDLLVHRHKYSVFAFTFLVIVVSFFGIWKMESVSFMVDDIPADDPIRKDLAFFEENFSGIMPLEIIIDTGVKRGVMQAKTLRKVEELESFLESHRDISKPVSIVSFIKASKQAYYNNRPSQYALPNSRERGFILRYFKNQSDESGLLNSFVDSSAQVMRVSLKVADIGSIKMDSLLKNVVEPQIDSIFQDTDLNVSVTGTTPLFIKGNKFLISNLRMSLVLAFIIIAIIMALLFSNLRMIVISLIPNFIPLIITAGLMGFFGIPLKPSTALIFSIAFGISVDDSIHFLAKYRQELFSNNFFVPLAVSKSLRETGASMMYTSIVLFFGFIIFAFSEFGGTVALGILTSLTLFVAMLTNLVLLPCLLLAFDDGKRKKEAHPLIEQYDDGFYQEDEDEEIDVKLISVDQAEEESNK